MYHMEILHKKTCLAAVISALLACSHAWAGEHQQPAHSASENASVDPDVLRARGLDPALAAYFQNSSRFMPGENRVDVSVNGIPKGQVIALFNAQGELCFTPKLLQAAGLLQPQGWQSPLLPEGASAQEHECHDYRSAYPQTQVELNPGTTSVAIIVPNEALAEEAQDYGDYSTGGIAGMLNYQANGLMSDSQGQRSRSLDVDTTGGFNAGDWIARSRQSFSSRDGEAVWSHYSAYAQKTLVKQAMIFQGGQINPTNTLFSVGALYGFQLFPEQALGVTESTQVLVTGIAQTQARVEVRQMGRVIYSTVVPPGPFTFTRLPLISNKADLDVTVTESTGTSSAFIVPASSFATLSAAQGFSMAAGQLQTATKDERPWVITATKGWAMTPRLTLSTGALGAQNYQGLGLGSEAQIFSWLRLGTQTQVARDPLADEQGGRSQGSLTLQASKKVSLSLSASYQTQGYRDLLDEITDGDSQQSRTQHQASASLSWSNELIGGLSAGYSQSTQFNSQKSQRVTGSWGRSIQRASLSLNVDRDIGDSPNRDSRIYLSLSIPFGRSTNVTSYVTSANNRASYGSTVSQRLSDTTAYSLSAQQSSGSDPSYNGNLSLVPHYTQLNMGYGRYGNSSTSYSFNASGGIAAHRHGVTLSPYAIQDTFGIAHVGNLSGIQVQTPQGPAWSDPWGNVVIPTLPEFRRSRIEVATKSLPRNVDINNGTQIVNAGHGSVSYFLFEVVRVQRLLLKTRLADGSIPLKGSSVTDEKGEFVTIVGDNGSVFLSNGNPDMKVYISLGGDGRCQLHYQVPEATESQYYQNADALCK